MGRETDGLSKLLGLAFAGADVLFEVDKHGHIVFAVGAVLHLAGKGPEDVLGLLWTDMFKECERALLDAALRQSQPGERLGPFRLRLAPKANEKIDRYVSLSTFELEQNKGRLSCALSLGAPMPCADVALNAQGLVEPKAFEEIALGFLAHSDPHRPAAYIELVQMDGFNAAMSAMDPETGMVKRQQVAATLRAASMSGLGASELAPDRFAYVRSATSTSDRLADCIQKLCGQDVKLVKAELALGAGTPEQHLKAMRYALDRFIEAGPAEAASSFMSILATTALKTAQFRSIVRVGGFKMAYQPVVNLDRNTLHHFEALARFGSADSPVATIRLAEELDLIVEFDLAVVKSLKTLLAKSPSPLQIAANISAISLMNSAFVDAVVLQFAGAPQLRSHLLFEVTETQKLADLPAANKTLNLLRQKGHQICLDDFGAGAATLDYLCQLDVDFVKTDGQYIKAIEDRPRDIMVIKHLSALCKELGLETIGEMVETAQTAKTLSTCGVAFGQGWFFGKPTPTPSWSPPTSSASPARRRVGMNEEWC